MFFVWFLCVSLLVGAWAARREVRAVLEDGKLALFGVRVRPARRPSAVRPLASPSPVRLPPPRVGTRPRSARSNGAG